MPDPQNNSDGGTAAVVDPHDPMFNRVRITRGKFTYTAMPFPTREVLAAEELRRAALAQTRSQRPAKREADEWLSDPRIEGFWQTPSHVFKVVIAVHGSGRPYARRFDPDQLDDPETFGWVYDRSLSHHEWLGQIRKHGKRLTIDRAGELGRLYGRCVLCGAVLTAEDSTDRGYGPTCAKHLEHQ